MMIDEAFARTPEPPYYAVIFTSTRRGGDEGYDAAARRMFELAVRQDGFLGVESARDESGLGITVSYWRDPAAIRAWREHVEHATVRERGRRDWYRHYQVRVARVERTYGTSGTEQKAAGP